MKEDRKAQTTELFHEVLAKEPDQQLNFLRDACVGDSDLFQRVKDLLDSYAEVKTIVPVPGKSPTEVLDSDMLIALGDRYQDIKPLGAGGMGIVLRAHDRELNKLVALKILHPAFADDPRAIERFRNEIRVALEITHKNVCRTYGLERVNGKILISMEYIEGETLRSILDSVRGVSIPQGISWTQEICEGLAAAHDKGIVHRDLKPENIMIDRSGHAKVMDFGIARSMESDRTAGTVIGTPQYMSPEQAMGRALAPTTDVYSLGLVLYELFTGLRRNPECPVSPGEANPYLPAHIDGAIRKCLAERPEDRFQETRELAAAVGHRSEAVLNETARLAVTTRRYKFGFFAALAGLGVVLLLSLTLARRISTLPALSQIAVKPPPAVASQTTAEAPEPPHATVTAPVKTTRPKADQAPSNANIEGAWSATVSDSKGSAAVQFNLVQNSEGEVVGTYTTSLEGGGSLKGKVNGKLLTFELTQSLKNCPGIFKGTATIAGDKGTGSYTGMDCLGDRGNGTLTMTKGGQVLSERQQIAKTGIGGYLRTKLLRWTQEDATNAMGPPVTHRYAYDPAKNIVGDVYTYPDPTLLMDRVELNFDSKTKRLIQAYLYPKKMTWDQCKQLWGEKFEAGGTNPDGSQLRVYKDQLIGVLVDKDNNVISLGLYALL